MKCDKLTLQFVDIIPEKLENSVLYISRRYAIAAHKCCCGCNEEVFTPIAKTDWSLRVYDGRVTLYPSIGNWSFACRSHYWVRRNIVIWADELPQHLIEHGRTSDRIAKKAYFKEVNRNKILSSHPNRRRNTHQKKPTRLLFKLWLILKSWFNS